MRTDLRYRNSLAGLWGSFEDQGGALGQRGLYERYSKKDAGPRSR